MANMTIDEATEDDVIGGSEYMPASDGGAPKKIKISQIAAYVLKCLRESGEQDFATTGTVSWKTSGGALKFSSGAKFAQSIIAYAFASAGIKDEDIADLESDETVFVVKVGDEEHVMTLAQLATYLQSQIIATIELNGLTSADTLSGADLMLVAQTSNNATTNKKVSLSTVRTFILTGLGAYLNSAATTAETPTTTEYVFSYNGTTLRKWTLGSMLALAGDVHGPSTTTANKVPQWDSVSKTLKDGLTVVPSSSGIASGTDEQLPTAKAAKEYTDTKVAAMVPNSTTAGNIPVYSNTSGALGTGKGVVTSATGIAIALTASDDKIPTEKAVRAGLDAEKDYIDNDVKFTVGTHSEDNIAVFGSSGRNLKAGPSVTDEVRATGADDTRIPTEKAVKDAIDDSLAEGVAAKSAATTVRSSTYADNDHVPTEKAVADALDTVVKTGLHADGEIPRFDGTGAQLKGGTALVTEVRSVSNASDAAIATEKAVRTAVDTVQAALDNKKLDALATPDAGTALDATSSRHGLMSAADKAKLEGLVDHDGASEINAALADNDTFLVSDISAQAVKKSKISRIWDYILNLIHETPLTALTVGADVTTSNATTEAPGLLPKLAGDASKYLKGDGTWGTPPGSQVFTPDTGAGGTTGLVPAPAAGDATKVLFGDGTWGAPPIQTGSEHVSIHDQAELVDNNQLADADELLVYHNGEFYKVTAAQIAAHAQAFEHRDVLWVPAGAITPNLTNGAVAETLSRSTGLSAFDTIRFTNERDSFADFDIVFPDDWNGGAIKLKLHWTPYNSGFSSSQVVRFGIKASFMTNHSPIDIAPATYAYIDDTVASYNQEHVTAALPITVDGTYLAGKRVHFWLKREATSSADTLTEQVSLLGVAIQFVRSGNMEAW